MNRSGRMLEVLQDGKPHSRRDLFDRIGFFLTNNAASELRAQGHDVRQSRERVDGDNVYFYTLHGSLPEASCEMTPWPESQSDDGADVALASESESEQLRLTA